MHPSELEINIKKVPELMNDSIMHFDFFNNHDIKHFNNENIKRILNNRKRTTEFRHQDHTKEFLNFFKTNYLKIGHIFKKKFEGHK